MGIQHVPEIKALVESGDIVLLDERLRYQKHTGKITLLSDDEIIEALAMEEDGPDDDIFSKAVENIESKKKAA